MEKEGMEKGGREKAKVLVILALREALCLPRGGQAFQFFKKNGLLPLYVLCFCLFLFFVTTKLS